MPRRKLVMTAEKVFVGTIDEFKHSFCVQFTDSTRTYIVSQPS